MLLKQVPRTATFAWSPTTGLPLLASGTVAGAVDADFSNTTELEIWDLNLLDQSQEAFELKSSSGKVSTDARFYDLAWGNVNNERPKGVIAGAMENGALDLWDPSAILDGKTSEEALIMRNTTHTGAIRSLEFNPFQPNLLATAGAKAEIYVWDLANPTKPYAPGGKPSRMDEVESIAWNQQVAHILATGGNTGYTTVWDLKLKRELLHLHYPGTSGGFSSGKRGISSVVWHPENATKLITASEDDQNPVILMWDLRNANAPEKILSGHEKGVLSLSWSKQDSDILLSCGKDNKTLCWNPNSGEMLGEVYNSVNWHFETRFNPKNPDLFADASFDGKISVHSLQNTMPRDQKSAAEIAASKPSGADFFNMPTYADPNAASSFTLKQAPKWLHRKTGATFGFGGKLVTFGSKGKSVNVTKVLTESSLSEDAAKFQEELAKEDLAALCETRLENAGDAEKQNWGVLKAFFEKDTRQRLIEYLGFKKDEIEKELEGKFGKLSVEETEEPTEDEQAEAVDTIAEPAVPGAEPAPLKKTHNKRMSMLFSGDSANGADFFGQLSSQAETEPKARGTRPFEIFSEKDTETDKLITKAVLLGQFEQAVEICLKEERLSDAFMLAMCGDEKCRKRVQTVYLQKRIATGAASYLRLISSSVIDKDLNDVASNVDLKGWKEVMVVLCTYAPEDDFSGLCELLGERLQQAGYTKEAAFCYLAGAKLEKVVNIWLDEYKEEETAALEKAKSDNDAGVSPFSVHAKALQHFIEKVTIFREAAKYEDTDISAVTNWKLESLYEKYVEYADVMASQGSLETAQKYLDLLPSGYSTTAQRKERITKNLKPVAAPVATQGYRPAAAQPAAPSFYNTTASANPYQAAAPSNPSIVTPMGAPQPAMNPYAPQQGYSAPAAPQQPSYFGGAQATGNYVPAFPQPVMPGPPNPVAPPSAPVMPPPSQARKMDGWNDAPVLPMPARRTPAPIPSPAPAFSPFPGQTAPAPGQTAVAPPPRGPSAAPLPPPPTNAKPPQRVTSPPQAQPGSAAMTPAVQGPPPTGAYAPNPAQSARMPASNPYAPAAAVNPGAPISVPPPRVIAPPPQANPYAPPPQAAAPPQASAYAPVPQQNAPAATSPYAPAATTASAVNPYAPPPMGARTPGLYGQSAPPQATTPSAAIPPPPQGPARQAPAQSSQTAAALQRLPTPAQSPPAGQPAQLAQPAAPKVSKYPAGDRTHIAPANKPIFDILDAEMQKIKAQAPPQFKRPVQDTEKRLNIFFDLVNNDDESLSKELLGEMLKLAQHVSRREWNEAAAIQLELLTNRTQECGVWMVGVKRLLDMGRSLPA
ncbi:protein transport protein S31 [Saitoella coloradoensis]